MEDEYKSFLAELGGGPPPSRGMDGGGGSGAPPMRRQRPGDDLPDDCKLYVGNLSPNVTDALLQQMFEPFGRVLHAVVLTDHETGTHYVH